jgi:hypothetical protein
MVLPFLSAEDVTMAEKKTRKTKNVSFYPLSPEQAAKRIFSKTKKPKGTGGKKK